MMPFLLDKNSHPAENWMRTVSKGKLRIRAHILWRRKQIHTRLNHMSSQALTGSGLVDKKTSVINNFWYSSIKIFQLSHSHHITKK